MRSAIGILAVACLLVAAAGAADDYRIFSFSTDLPRNECSACFFSSDSEKDGCSACFFSSDSEKDGCSACFFSSDSTSVNGFCVCEFSIHGEGDGHSTYQISGDHIRFSMVYRSPQSALDVQNAFSRDYRGYKYELPSVSNRQEYFTGSPGLNQGPGNLQEGERFKRIFGTSSGFSRFL